MEAKHEKWWPGIFIALPVVVLVLSMLSGCKSSTGGDEYWSEISSQEKPWTRWWWMGNILDKEDITYQLEAFSEAGLGGVEITPIYGVKGYEDSFIDHLSVHWISMVEFTLYEAARLGLGVDIILGTGWPYGGPQVESENAASYLNIKKIHLDENETFDAEIIPDDPRQHGKAELMSLVYFDESNRRIDLTPNIKNNRLLFTSAVPIDMYAIFCAKTRQMVKRAAPGGVGYSLDHFSKRALEDYLEPYDSAFIPLKGKLRSVFNDSYEVYNADFSKGMLESFFLRRGYNLLDQIYLLSEKPETEVYKRIVCDYRQTLSDLLLEEFAEPWTQWSHENDFISRYQAHGSPGNLIDLYAAADIPECEIFGSPEYGIPGYRRDSGNIRKGDNNKMMLKFCSSSAHLQGNELVSSESFTWLREHFKTALSHCKPVADDFFFGGVNHIFLHGATYSPMDETWPGFKFYASVNFNPTNTIWRDASFLFEYIGRCQSILQKAKTDNQVLIYWPVFDAYTDASNDRLLFQYSIHSIDEWLTNSSFYKLAEKLDSEGIGFDFISDKFIEKSSASKGELIVSENAKYKILIVPACEYIPLETLKKLMELKRAGASIIFQEIPESVPGFFQYEQRVKVFSEIIEDNKALLAPPPDLRLAMEELGIKGEEAVKAGLKVLRKKLDGNAIYFVANHSSKAIDQYVRFNTPSKEVLVLDPMSGKKGSAKIKMDKYSTEVKLSMLPGESLFLSMHSKQLDEAPWEYYQLQNEKVKVGQSWQLEFISGENPPNSLVIDQLSSWTDYGPDYEAYSGTARYSSTFELPKQAAVGYFLDLGDVRESARVFVNGKFAGARIAHPFVLDISGFLKDGENELLIEVTNLSANRIRQKEISGDVWERFYDINIVNINYEDFNAAQWEVSPSGLNSDIFLLPSQ